jgi:hypothetical protein
MNMASLLLLFDWQSLDYRDEAKEHNLPATMLLSKEIYRNSHSSLRGYLKLPIRDLTQIQT